VLHLYLVSDNHVIRWKNVGLAVMYRSRLVFEFLFFLN